jgi:predicted lipoprotein with Yx(FWY)xxD motif
MKIVTGLLIVAILAMVGFIGISSMHPALATKPAVAEVSTMPPGITFGTVGAVQAMSVMGAFKGYDVLTDAKTMTLYTSDKDPAGKSACTGDCAKAWLPLAAAADAKSSGFWRVIVRDDGSRQWSIHGKPLYTYAEDKRAGDYKGNSVDGWHFVLNQAMAGIPLPDGISAAEIVAAGGQAFVDVHGHTLYTYGGDLKSDVSVCAAGAECVNHWQPLAAGELANALGDFSVIARPDGSRQWAYQGQALYTYDGDL